MAYNFSLLPHLSSQLIRILTGLDARLLVDPHQEAEYRGVANAVAETAWIRIYFLSFTHHYTRLHWFIVIMWLLAMSVFFMFHCVSTMQTYSLRDCHPYNDIDNEGFLYGRGGNGDAGRVYAGDSEWDYHENDKGVDSYYKSMIELNPDNALILGNYAKDESYNIANGSNF
nr:hypothetical protein [Tanacetum cinerariifolium]